MRDPLLDLGRLVRRAFEIAATTDTVDKNVTVNIRAHIARVAQRVGLGAELGDRLAEAFAAETKLKQDRDSQLQPEEQAELQRLADLEQLARRHFLDGNVRQAEELYLAGEDLRPDRERKGLQGAHGAFLNWLLEAGDLSRSVSFFRLTDWIDPVTLIDNARRLAGTLIKAGQRSTGLDLLRNLRPALAGPDAPKTLSQLGQAFWRFDETQEGVAMIREAVRESLAAVAGDVQTPLDGYSGSEPISLAQLQCAIGDREGAMETLRGVMKLAVPVSYDPPHSRPADLPAAARFISGGPRLKPASARWLASLPAMIRVLARVGLDEFALTLVPSVEVGQIKLLAEVARGQARRGAYTEAFRTVERMKVADLFEANEPSRVIFKSDGTVTTAAQTSPVRRLEPLERNAAIWRSLSRIRMYAADAGDAEAFRLADDHRTSFPNPNEQQPQDLLHLDLLVHGGALEQALASVNEIPNQRERLFALRHVVDLALKAAMPTRDQVLANLHR